MIAPLAALGLEVTRRVSDVGALARFVWEAAASAALLTPTGRRVALRVFGNQVWFTALQAVPLIIALSGILSFLVISQAVRELGRLGATELIGTLMVVAIVRELGPLLTALSVVGRSGTAIAAELATNRVMGEVDALEGMGIDPQHYLVLPRVAAAVVSVSCLIVLFDLVAIFSGLVAAVANGMSTARYFQIVLRSLSFGDAGVSALKGLAFGAIIGTVPCFHGLRVARAPTEVPIASSQAVVSSILLIFLTSALFVAVR